MTSEPGFIFGYSTAPLCGSIRFMSSHVGVEPHGFTRGRGVARLDAAADYFLAVDAEEHHGLHAHRLDQAGVAGLIAVAPWRLGDVLGRSPSRSFLPLSAA
jgi:hypothetical protein